ncbi:MAG: hypothetical protein IJM38_04895 [Ruminococcus sp.]|nr:hypothetical protein [Ruminococcus sp.]
MRLKQIYALAIIFMAVTLLVFAPIFKLCTHDSIIQYYLTAATLFMFAMIIVGIFMKTSKMMKKLGVSSTDEFEELKNNCDYNYKNRLYLSDEWVINTYTLRVYRTEDIVKVTTKDGHYRNGVAYTHYINVQLRYSYDDKFVISNERERDNLAVIINGFAKAGKNAYYAKKYSEYHKKEDSDETETANNFSDTDTKN